MCNDAPSWICCGRLSKATRGVCYIFLYKISKNSLNLNIVNSCSSLTYLFSPVMISLSTVL